MGRPKESGFRSQLCILGVLREYGPLYGQEIVDKTGLKREEVWRNLKVLLRKKIIKKEKVGRRKYYRPIVSEQTLDYIIYILYEDGLRRFQQKARRYYRKARKLIKLMFSVAEKAEKYENEIVELAARGEEPYVEILDFAKTWREVKKEMFRVGQRPSFQLSDISRNKERKTLVHPKKLQTKMVTLPSGLQVTIRRMTVFEIIDIVRRLRALRRERQEETDPHLIGAIEKLSQ